MKKIDYNKHIWEGWTVLGFINDLQPSVAMIITTGAIKSRSGQG